MLQLFSKIVPLTYFLYEVFSKFWTDLDRFLASFCQFMFHIQHIFDVFE